MGQQRKKIKIGVELSVYKVKYKKTKRMMDLYPAINEDFQKIVDKATSKMIFGTDKEYSYKVEPVHDKSTGVTAFAPVFYVGNSKVSMPDPSDPSKRKAVDGMSIMKVIIQRAIKGMKAGKSNILTATTEDIRPTRSTTTP